MQHEPFFDLYGEFLAGKIAVHSPTRDEAKALFDILYHKKSFTTWNNGMGLKEKVGSNFLYNLHYEDYEGDTVYYVNTDTMRLRYGNCRHDEAYINFIKGHPVERVLTTKQFLYEFIHDDIY